MTDPASDLGLLLCADRTAGSSLEGILHALQSRQPGLAVFAEPELCRHGERVAARVKEQRLEAVVVGTSHRACVRLWPEVMTRAGISPFDVHVVPLDPAATPGRAEALLWGRLCRALIREPVPPECVKTRVPPPRGAISRRALLTSLLRRPVITIPAIDRRRCRGRQGCRRCVAVCPLGALRLEAGALAVDRTRCEGCGLCVKACPVEALRLPSHTWRQLLAEVDGILAVPDGPRLAVFYCGDGPPRDLPPDFFPLGVPCVAMLPVWLLLRVLVAGAVGVAIVPAGERCRAWHGDEVIGREVRVGRLILEILGIESDRIQILGTSRELPMAAGRMARLAPPAPLRESLDRTAESPARLAALLMAIRRARGGRPATRYSSDDLPFGLVTVAAERCTLCGVCAALCPTAALDYREEPGRAVLRFDPRRCDGCRACATACPETALIVSRTLDLDALMTSPRSLADEEMARCRRCGREFAPPPALPTGQRAALPPE